MSENKPDKKKEVTSVEVPPDEIKTWKEEPTVVKKDPRIPEYKPGK